MNGETKNERDVLRIMIWGTAIAFGFLAASLQALRPNPTGFVFQVSAVTILAFAVGTAIVVVFWRIILNRSRNKRQQSRRIWAEVVLLLLGLGAFLYPLRFVPTERLPEMITGLVIAVCALSLVGCLLLMMGKFLESDERENRLASDDAIKKQFSRTTSPGGKTPPPQSPQG